MKDLEKQRLVQEEEPSRGCREFQTEPGDDGGGKAMVSGSSCR